MKVVKLIFTVFIFVFGNYCYSQNNSKNSEFWNQVRFGGGIGLGFTNIGFNASISPSAIYQFNELLAVGPSLNFNYSKFNDNKFLAYGGSLLALCNPIQQIQLSTEFEELRINRTINSQSNSFTEDYWLPAFFVGLGYSTQNLTIGLRYDLLFNDNKSIYNNALMPFIRVYF